MANRKISDLTSLTAPATGDLLPIVDISEAAAADKNKKITYRELLASAPAGTAAAPSFSFDGDPNTGIYNPGADQVAISTNGTGKLFVDASGNVALGAATFSKPFTIINQNAAISLRANSTGTYSDQGIFFAVDATNYAQILNSDIGQLIFRTGSGLSERLRITSAGLVGIGTSLPDVGLHYRGDTPKLRIESSNTLEATAGTEEIGRLEWEGFKTSNFTVAASIRARQDGTWSTSTQWIAPAALEFYTQNNTGVEVTTPRMLIDSSGRVGIGITSPGAALHVSNGNDSASGEFIGLILGGTNSNNARTGSLIKDTTTFDLIYRNNNFSSVAGSHVFKNGNSEHARIDSSGRLLVGTSTSITTVIAAGLQVQSTGASAYASIGRWDNNAANPGLVLNKSRGGSVGTLGIVQVNDSLGELNFTGDDGSAFVSAARIQAQVDGTPGVNDMPGRLVFSTTADGAATLTERMRINSNGFTTFTGSIGRGAPVTKTGAFTVGISENWLICNGTASITVTLPTASAWTGREIMLKTIAAFTVISASSNVVPLVGGAASTAILAATAGKYATLVSDGTNWIIMQAN